MSEKLRIGLIGSGGIANAHIAAFQATNEVEIVALWNRTQSRAVDLAKAQQLVNVKIYDDWQEMLSEADLDAVSVVTGPQLRAKPVCMALNRGIHTLVEKPFATNLKDADEMISAAQKSRCAAAVCFTWRYKSSILAARRLLKTGEVGDIRHYESIWRMSLPSQIDPSIRPYLIEAQDGLGMVGDNGSHQFDTIGFLTGEDVSDIASHLSWVEPNNPDLRTNFSHHILGKNGKGIGIYFEHTIPPGQFLEEFHRQIYVEGSKGYVKIEGNMLEDEKVLIRLENANEPTMILPKSAEQSIPRLHEGLIRDFITAVRNPADRNELANLPTFEDGLRSLEIAIAALKADKVHKWVAKSELRQ